MSMSMDAKDLDETRRLLYMALYLPESDRWYSLAGTLTNALAHHGLGVTYEESMTHIRVLCDGTNKHQHGDRAIDDYHAACQWAHGLIERCTVEIAALGYERG